MGGGRGRRQAMGRDWMGQLHSGGFIPGDADKLFQDQEDDEPWVGDVGIRDSMDYMGPGGRYGLLPGRLKTRPNLRINVYLQEEILEEYDEDDNSTLTLTSPASSPSWPVHLPQCRKSFKLQLSSPAQLLEHGPDNSPDVSHSNRESRLNNWGICSNTRALKLL